MTGIMKEKLNHQLGAEVVREIVLKAGKVDVPAAETTEKKAAKKDLTPTQKALIEEHSSGINDMETRRAFAELMKTSMESTRGVKQ